MKTNFFFLLFAAALGPAAAQAETIRIITPYIGSITNKYSNSAYSMNLKDTGEMDGLYAQWINTEKFQANGFYYRAPGVNLSVVTGLHLNADYYIKPTKSGKYAVGAGLENLDIDMSAGKKIPPLTSFDMDNDILFYFLRAGRYFYYKAGPADFSVMPYAGYARETVNGKIKMRIGMGPLRSVDIDDDSNYPLFGLNLDTTLAHFLQVQGKWMGRYKDGRSLNEYSVMANIFLNRHWGLSYRYKYMKYDSEFIEYNLAGVAYCF